ncbi:TldD/PmbA family protein [Pseudaestuariivita rosea]|uniref:TldD/PmbA family protein n=1 Tax=Pseudaestuariivita rosea TaxID=2763263 RepID=UPI001ABB1F88|nr:TldD/PmbA family protein [Pseudaestuariivita rosea]
MHKLDELTQSAVAAALKAGADAADVIAVDGTSISIDVRGGVIEQAERSEGVDLGLRVLIGKRQACVSTSDISPQTVEKMAERAVAMANEAPEDPFAGLATADQLAQNADIDALELTDPAAEPQPTDLEADARQAEATAMAVKGISQVQSSSAAYTKRHIHLAASNGFSGGYARTDRSLYCVAIAGEGTGMERDYDGDSRIFQADLRSPQDIGQSAADRTIARQGAKKPKTGSFPVLFDERVSSSLIGHLITAINGTMIARGSSWLRDGMGEQVLPGALSVIEDPHRRRIAGSRPFDAEGLPTRRRAIVENGILCEWTLDLATARKLGLDSTANAVRGTSAPPSPSVSNIELTQGDKTQQELIQDMGTGLLVTSMIGSSINPTTGDYSRGASGFWVENGEVQYPVNECTIAGNLRAMLKTIIPANDARPYLSRVVPSLLVEGLTIAGE